MKLKSILYSSVAAVAIACAAQGAAFAASGSVTGSYLSGQFAKNRGDTDEAIRNLETVYRRNPKDISVAVQLQGMLLLEGRFDEALLLAEDIENSDTKDSLSDLLLVLRQVKNNNPDEASNILDSVAEDGTTQLWMPLLAGWVDISRHQLTKPLMAEELGVDVGRALPLVNYHLALINDQGGFKEAAAQNFKNAIEDPANPPDRIIKMLLAFYDRNNSPAILTPIVKAYKDGHPNAEAMSPPPVIATPKDGIAEVLYTMGGIMYGAGVINDAAIYLQLTTYIKPDMDEATVALADAYGELKQYSRSNATYAKITPQSPYYARAQLHIATNYERMGKLPEALKRLDAMVKTSPEAAVDVLVTKGDLLRTHARFEEAITTYNDVLNRMSPQNDDRWAILFARATCLDRMGEWPVAEKDLQQALVLKPDQPDVLNYLGFARLEHGETMKEAGDMIAKAVKVRPNDAEIVDSMGWALYLQGNYEEAKGYLEKAVELLPGDPTVNDHLGDAYWQLGRKTEARYQWERSLTFSPESKLIAIIHKKLKEGLPPPATMAGVIPEGSNGKPLVAATP